MTTPERRLFDLLLIMLVAHLASPGRVAAPPPPRTAHVIVSGVDRALDWRRPFAPEPWWPIGARLFGYFDHDIVLANGRDLPDLVARLDATLRERGFTAIRHIEIWTHGHPGTFRVEHRSLGREVFTSRDQKLSASLQTLRARLAGGAVVHFRSCSTFHGPVGQAFAETASRFFNATGKSVIVMGHTRPTGLIHPGWKTLLPGRDATWSDGEGLVETRLEGAQILIRDLLWICSGGAAECVPYSIERLLPAFWARIERCVASVLAPLMEPGHEMSGLQESRSGAAPHRRRGR